MLTEVNSVPMGKNKKWTPMREFAEEMVSEMARKPAGCICKVSGYGHLANDKASSTPAQQFASAANNAICRQKAQNQVKTVTRQGQVFLVSEG